MKKLLAFAIISLFSLSCMAVDSVQISINNKSDKAVDIRDQNNNSTSIDAHRTGQMLVRLHKQRNTFPLPNDLLPHITTLTVDDGDRSTSIVIDERTKILNISPELDLEKD